MYGIIFNEEISLSLSLKGEPRLVDEEYDSLEEAFLAAATALKEGPYEEILIVRATLHGNIEGERYWVDAGMGSIRLDASSAPWVSSEEK
jgi:formylmethanofuran dehydrogenase subunit A